MSQTAALMDPKVATGKFVDGLTADTPLREALPAIVRNRAATVLQLIRPVLHDGESDNVEEVKDIEHVHQLRVATRRFAAAMTLVEMLVPETPHEKLDREIKLLRRLGGKARDLDVQIRFLEQMLLIPEQTHDVSQILQQFQLRRAALQDRLERRLPLNELRLERRVRKYLEQLQADLESRPAPWESQPEDPAAPPEVPAALVTSHPLPPAPPVGEADHRTFRSCIVPAIQQCLSALWLAAPAADADFSLDKLSAPTLHQVRIVCKQFRYLAELGEPVLPQSFWDGLYPQLQQIQDALGEVQDSVAAVEGLTETCPAFEDDEIDGEQYAHGLMAVLKVYSGQAEAARHELAKLWPPFATTGFREPLTHMLDQLSAAESSQSANEN